MIERSAETAPVATVGIFLWPGMTMQDVIAPAALVEHVRGMVNRELIEFVKTRPSRPAANS